MEKKNPLPPVTGRHISSLRGCCKGKDSLVEAREREHREQSFAERRWNRSGPSGSSVLS